MFLSKNKKNNIYPCKKGKKKVQGVPQSQAAAHPRFQEEEETDKPNKRKSNKALRLALYSPSEVIARLKGLSGFGSTLYRYVFVMVQFLFLCASLVSFIWSVWFVKDRSKAVVPQLVLLFVALWFIL